MIEATLLVVSLILLCTYGLWREYAANRNEQRQASALSTVLDPLLGEPIERAIERFGQPAEFVGGTTGRALYIWLAPPAERFPLGTGILVVTLTADPEGKITDATWTSRAG